MNIDMQEPFTNQPLRPNTQNTSAPSSAFNPSFPVQPLSPTPPSQTPTLPKKTGIARFSRIIFVIGIVVIIGTVTLTYGVITKSDKQQDKQTPTLIPTSPEAALTPTSASIMPSKELEKILEEGRKITTLKYDLIETVLLGSKLPTRETVTLSETIWREGERARIDFKTQNHTLSTRLIDGNKQAAIIYLPDQQLAHREDFDYVINLQDRELSFPEKGLVECPSWDVIGEETIEGKSCFVARCPPVDTGTYWIWKQYGVPIKNETKSASGGTITIEHKNMEFDDVPDSIFELPAGIPVLEEGELPPGLLDSYPH